MEQRVADCDAVINAAGLAAPDCTDAVALRAANEVLPCVLYELCRATGVRRFVHLSSAAVQGGGDLDESARTAPFSAYSASKARGEKELLARASADGPELVIYRPTSVMAPDRPVTNSLRRRCSGLVPVVDLDTPLPLAHVANVASAARFLATVEALLPRIVTHPSEYATVADLIEWCGGRSVRLPATLAKFVTGLLSVAARFHPALDGLARRIDLFLNGQRIHATSLLEFGWEPAVTKGALAELFRPSDDRRPLRLAFLITRSDTVGGAHVHVRDLARSLIDLGHDARVFVGGEGPYCKILRDLGVPVDTVESLVRPLNLRSERKAYQNLVEQMGEFDPHVLSTHSSKAGIIGRLVGRHLGIPTIFTAHGWAFTSGVSVTERLVYSVIETAAASLAKTIVCVSDNDYALARRRGIHLLSRTVSIPNAVEDVSADLRADPSVEPVRLVMVARLDKQKCQEEVLEALSGLRHLDYAIDFIGDGPREAELRRLAESIGIADRTRFLGLRRDVEVLLGESQIFVLMSNYEGMPRSLLEAMRAGLPVVASRTGGVPEVVVDGVTGVLVEPHATVRLEQTLEMLITDAGLRSRLGAAGRQRYEDRYELSRLVRNMLPIYRALAAAASE